MKQYIEVTYRDIAKMLASALPVEDEEFGHAVETRLRTIKSMSRESKIALKTAYVFSRKVPREEREDLFQTIALAVLKAKTPEEKLAYAIGRFDWMDWWRRFKVRQHQSLDTVIEDSEGNPATMMELLVGECEFEAKMDGKIEGERLWNLLPDRIKPIVNKRFMGKPLNSTDRTTMEIFIKTTGYKLLLA